MFLEVQKMPSCENCGGAVDSRAHFCQNCGRPNPGKGDTAAGIVLVIFLALAAFFLAPAIICIWPFSSGFADAFGTAFTHLLAWTGSLAFWGLCHLIFANQNIAPNSAIRFVGVWMLVPFLLVVPIKGCNRVVEAWDASRVEHEFARQRDAITQPPVAILILENQLLLGNDIAESVVDVRSDRPILIGKGVHRGIDFEDPRVFKLYSPSKKSNQAWKPAPMYVFESSDPQEKSVYNLRNFDTIYAVFEGDGCLEKTNRWLGNQGFEMISLPVIDASPGSIHHESDTSLSTDPSLRLLLLHEHGEELVALEILLKSTARFHGASDEERFFLQMARELTPSAIN